MMDAAQLSLGSALVLAIVAAGAGWLAFRATWLGPAAVMLTAPFAWYHQVGPTELTVSKAAFVGAAIGVFAALAANSQRRARALAAIRANPAVWTLVAFALLSALSTLWASSPADAIRDALKWIWYAGAFTLTVVAVETPDEARKVVLAMFAAAAVVAIDGLWQNATSAPAGFVAANGAIVARIVGTLEGPNQFGAYLETAIPPLLAVLLFARLSRVALVAGIALLGILVADLPLTYSRGALWSCAAAVAIVLIAYFRSQRGSVTVRFRTAAAIAAGVAVLALPVVMTSIGAQGWQHEFWSERLRDTTASTEHRRQMWTCAALLYARHPVAGVGAGNFVDLKNECGASLSVPERFNANQWYLETAADLGTIGLAALVAFLVTLLAQGRRKAIWTDPTLLGAYGVLVAFTLHGFVDDVMTYPKAALSFFVLMGLLAGRPAQAAEAD